MIGGKKRELPNAVYRWDPSGHVDVVISEDRLKDPNGYQITVAGENAETLTARHVIVATGSLPRALPGAPFDNKLILDNDGALAIPDRKSDGFPSLGVVRPGVR